MWGWASPLVMAEGRGAQSRRPTFWPLPEAGWSLGSNACYMTGGAECK